MRSLLPVFSNAVLSTLTASSHSSAAMSRSLFATSAQRSSGSRSRTSSHTGAALTVFPMLWYALQSVLSSAPMSGLSPAVVVGGRTGGEDGSGEWYDSTSARSVLMRPGEAGEPASTFAAASPTCRRGDGCFRG